MYVIVCGIVVGLVVVVVLLGFMLMMEVFVVGECCKVFV